MYRARESGKSAFHQISSCFASVRHVESFSQTGGKRWRDGGMAGWRGWNRPPAPTECGFPAHDAIPGTIHPRRNRPLWGRFLWRGLVWRLSCLNRPIHPCQTSPRVSPDIAPYAGPSLFPWHWRKFSKFPCSTEPHGPFDLWSAERRCFPRQFSMSYALYGLPNTNIPNGYLCNGVRGIASPVH